MQNSAPSATEVKQNFSIQRIYVKDLSFEAPKTPEVFQLEWAPQVNLDMSINSKKLASDSYEVTLHITVTVKLADQVAFLVEVQQSGIFAIQGFAEEQLKHMLSSFCPNILFPYAREVISETVCRGSFPPLYLSPINFDALYQEEQQRHDNPTENTQAH